MSTKTLPVIDSDAKLISEFRQRYPVYKEFSEKLKTLIIDITNEHADKLHSITARVKKESSLEGKLRAKKKYTDLDQITDIIGIRIITRYEEDVHIFSKIIEENFRIDAKNSVDKGKLLETDRFGYKSVHYVFKLNSERNKLKEYKAFKDISAEIQIRSIIQHAWAEIEHDLGYKSAIEVPHPLKRRFFRLAALLEIADDEFSKLRADLSAYEKEIVDRIRSKPEAVAIDGTSLKMYVGQSKVLNRLNESLAKVLGNSFPNDKIDEDMYGLFDVRLKFRIKELALVQIQTLGELEEALKTHGKSAVQIAAWALRDEAPPQEEQQTDNLTILFFLCYALAAQHNDVNVLTNYLTKADISVDGESKKQWAQRILDSYNALRK